MRQRFMIFCIFLCAISNMPLFGQSKVETTRTEASMAKEDTALTRPQKSVTRGTVTIEGKKTDYQAVAGTLVLKDENEKPTCSMFYVAYFKSEEPDVSARPVTFLYNGGPGSSTVWLHMGAWGPRRVEVGNVNQSPATYKTVNNDYCLLDASDLVFIDAPGTGYSRIIDKDMGGAGNPKDFYGIDEDARAFTSFITKFLTTYNRWESPKYLFGESYGTMRSVLVAYRLGEDEGVNVNGVILLSQVLNFVNFIDRPEIDPGIDLPYQLVLPAMTATAWYHHRLPHQPEKLEPLITEVKDFAMNEYAQALLKGALLDTAEFTRITQRLHEYTGLPLSYVRKANLRVSGPDFEKTLLSDSDKIIGRLDTRFSGFDVDPLAEYPEYDPVMKRVTSIFVSCANSYLHSTLKYGIDKTYEAFGDMASIGRWDFRHTPPGTSVKLIGNVMPDLARAMIYNPNLKILLNMGYFDLATPFFQGEFEMHHLPIPAELQKNISYAHYKSGHMVYLHLPSLKQMHDNTARFINMTH